MHPRLRGVRHLLATAGVTLLLAACAGSRIVAPADTLDPDTGATVTRLAEPLLFYSEDPARAANARDHLSVAPIRVNRSGKRTWWLWVAAWSTIDRGVTGADRLPEVTAFQLLADGEPIELDATGRGGSVPGVSELPYAPPVPTARILLLPMTASQAGRIARAAALEIRTDMAAGPALAWLPWEPLTGSGLVPVPR